MVLKPPGQPSLLHLETYSLARRHPSCRYNPFPAPINAERHPCLAILCHSIGMPIISHYSMASSPSPNHNRTSTSTQGIRNDLFSKNPLIHSNPFPLPTTISPLPTTRFFTLSIAALAMDPPVPLIALTAMPAVSTIVSVNVALPPKYADAVSEGDKESEDHRGSNQSAVKSKSEKTRTKSSIEQ